MSEYSLTHLGDRALERELAENLAEEHGNTARQLALLGEVDARKLYLPAAYPSMYAFCVGECRMCEQEAFKRIRAARAARRHPGIFEAVAAGRLCVSAVVVLAPHLTPENADELLALAEQKSMRELEQLLAERFPRPDLPARLEPLSPGKADAPTLHLAPVPVGPVGSGAAEFQQLSTWTVGASAAVPAEPQVAQFIEAPAPPPPPALRPKFAPLSPGRFALQVTLDERTRAQIEHARALLGHTRDAQDLPALVARAFDALIEKLEKQKFAATSSPRKRASRASANPRHVPAEVKRAVWRRDQGRCTFVSESGRRCPEKSRLEYDHAEPIAQGGRASVETIRLRCRAHNQYAAECAFGAGFMEQKRREARRAAAARAVRFGRRAETGASPPV